MIRLFVFLVLAGMIAFGLAWISSLQGTLVLTVAEYRITASIKSAVAVTILFGVFSALSGQVLWLLLTASGALGRRLNARRKQLGNGALSRGFIAAAAGDVPEAVMLAKKAQVLLGPHPLSLLLSAQAARLEGNEVAQAQAWRAMLARTDTILLGLRGLFVQAMRRGDTEGALAFVSRAQTLKPKARWALDASFDLKIRQRQWADAKSALDAARHALILDEASARRRETVLLTAEALDAEQGADREAALSGALAALSLSPGFSPAAVLAARILARSGREWRAEQVLATAWTSNPTPAVAQAFAALRTNEPAQARAQRLTGLALLNRDHFESRLLLAEQAVMRRDGAEARRLLLPFARGRTTRRLCTLMGEIERLEDHDTWASHAWLSFATHATPDSDWRCEHCGVASAEWQAVCAHCGAFDALVWPVPPGHSLDRSCQTPPMSNSVASVATSAQRTDPHRQRNTQVFAAEVTGSAWRRRLHADNGCYAGPPAPDDLGPGRFPLGREPAR